MKKILLSLLFILCVLFPLGSSARSSNEIDDWYISDFLVEIIVNEDSSLDITENIVADCGTLSGKHGIIRRIPTFYQKNENEKVSTPVKLESITDFDGKPYEYETSKESGIITWKIGSPFLTVRGENDYKIKYHVDNTIRFGNDSFDEFYWNLNGNFWTIETDSFRVDIVFPEKIGKSNTKVNFYTGKIGEKDVGLAHYEWVGENTLRFSSDRTLKNGEGITASVIFPKNIIKPPGFWLALKIKMSEASFWLGLVRAILVILPVLIFCICFMFWYRKGRDEDLGSIAPEFDVPDSLTPIVMGTIWKNNKMLSRFISAEMVYLAVKGFIKIEQSDPNPGRGKIYRAIFGGNTETTLIGTYKEKELDNIAASDRLILEAVFGFEEGARVKLSDLENSFYTRIAGINSSVLNEIGMKGFFSLEGFGLKEKLFSLAGVFGFFTFAGIFVIAAGGTEVFNSMIGSVIWGGLASVLILVIFGFLMPKKTSKGARIFRKILGFELYMKTAEKYRQKFNEKENIFEKFLPYAIMFGIADMWASKMKELYSEQYLKDYSPDWYSGSLLGSSLIDSVASGFDVGDFTNSINSISESMASAIISHPSESGSSGWDILDSLGDSDGGGFSGGGGGGGFSGGGGGGGGGSGW